MNRFDTVDMAGDLVSILDAMIFAQYIHVWNDKCLLFVHNNLVKLNNFHWQIESCKLTRTHAHTQTHTHKPIHKSAKRISKYFCFLFCCYFWSIVYFLSPKPRWTTKITLIFSRGFVISTSINVRFYRFSRLRVSVYCV